MQLAGKHVLVTGAAKRVGRAIAERLVTAGTGLKLTAHYRSSRSEAEELALWAAARNAHAHTVAADLRKVSELKKLVDAAVARFGPIDVLVNSASDFYPTPALTVTEAQWDALFDVNLKGQFFLAQACAATMQGRGGAIVNITDVNGERAIGKYAPYSASKAGLLHLTRVLAKEWAPSIRVNSVSPGAVLFPDDYTEEQKAKAVSRAPLARTGTAQDVAEGVLFLLENDYVNGFTLNVDGGRSIG